MDGFRKMHVLHLPCMYSNSFCLSCLNLFLFSWTGIRASQVCSVRKQSIGCDVNTRISLVHEFVTPPYVPTRTINSSTHKQNSPRLLSNRKNRLENWTIFLLVFVARKFSPASEKERKNSQLNDRKFDPLLGAAINRVHCPTSTVSRTPSTKEQALF